MVKLSSCFMGLQIDIISELFSNKQYNKLQCGGKFERVSRNMLNTYSSR